MKPKSKILLKTDNKQSALLQINGLSILERNIRSFQNENFEVFLETSPSLQDFLTKLPIISSHDFLTEHPSGRIFRGDVQYELKFFQEIKDPKYLA